MAFSKDLKFSDLTKLLEAVSTNKEVKKRDRFMGEYLEKLHKFRGEYKKQHPDKVSLIFPFYS